MAALCPKAAEIAVGVLRIAGRIEPGQSSSSDVAFPERSGSQLRVSAAHDFGRGWHLRRPAALSGRNSVLRGLALTIVGDLSGPGELRECARERVQQIIPIPARHLALVGDAERLGLVQLEQGADHPTPRLTWSAAAAQM